MQFRLCVFCAFLANFAIFDGLFQLKIALRIVEIQSATNELLEDAENEILNFWIFHKIE